MTRPSTFLDALAGLGARGIRVANECDRRSRVHVTMVDFNEASVAVARRNVRINGLEGRCTVVHSETNRYLWSRFDREEKFAAVDIDPFGTPALYIQAALMASLDDAIVSVTATDAAVLCGVYPSVAARRYGALSPRTESVHETGARTLIAFIARMGGVGDMGVEPVLAYSTLHYLRAYVRVKKGASRADRALSSLGYVAQCEACHKRTIAPAPPSSCPGCGKRVRPAGPLWLGKVSDDEITAAAADACARQGWREAESILAELQGVNRFPPYGYSLQRACSRVGVPSTSVTGVIRVLGELGFQAMRQPFEKEGIKTTATYPDFLRAVKVASGASTP